MLDLAQCRGLVLVSATAAFFVAAAPASSHTLSVKKARNAIKQVTEDWAFDSDLTERYWVDNCGRRSDHRVNCKAHIRGYNSGLGATETCTRKASARLRRKKVRTALGDETKCTFDYGDDDGGGGYTPPEPPPAPDTRITSGPAEGSTVSPQYGSAFVTFEFVAEGGEDPHFECSVDGGEFMACSSPTTYDYAPGPHTFRVRAVSIRLGTTPTPDPTPASRSFTVAPSG
jgi:hypothetical protein